MIEHLNSDNYEKENYVGKLRNEKKNLNNSAKGTFDDEAKSGNNKGQSNKLDSFTKKNEDNGKVKTSCGSMDSKHNAKDNVEKQDNFVEKVVQTSARINVSGQSEPMHSGRIQVFLSNGCVGCIYLVKILAHCAMLQCMSRYNKPP